jgi:23S rRNA (uracil1939-C5)-methyltransferase
MTYEAQLYYKQKQVEDNLRRIGRIANPNIRPILASPSVTHYRNKLEYTFSSHRWLTIDDKVDGGRLPSTNAVGFHVPGFFDKVVDIETCFHQPDPSNAIRNNLRDYALKQGLSFYDVRRWQGFLRNLIIRTSRTDGLMVILVVREDDQPAITGIMDHLIREFPQITSLYYVVNEKKNDVITDLDLHHYSGSPFITERMDPFRPRGKSSEFRIGPTSFFQTNPAQAENLYRIAAEMADFIGDETVYDLYTGTGTIAVYCAPYVKKVVGIESVHAAIEDAEVNAEINGIDNTLFFSGEVEKVLTNELFQAQGKPDVIITDPPRAGMHERVIRAILDASPEKIIYISCNPATQARDISLMSHMFEIVHCQPVDMFPHTQHVENVALMRRVLEE